MSSSTTSPGSGKLTLLLFASASTFAGGLETLTLPAPTTLREVFTALETRFPGMTKRVLAGAAVTVNLEYVDFEIEELERRGEGESREGLDMPLNPGDEVGIIPPVSSG